MDNYFPCNYIKTIDEVDGIIQVIEPGLNTITEDSVFAFVFDEKWKKEWVMKRKIIYREHELLKEAKPLFLSMFFHNDKYTRRFFLKI